MCGRNIPPRVMSKKTIGLPPGDAISIAEIGKADSQWLPNGYDRFQWVVETWKIPNVSNEVQVAYLVMFCEAERSKRCSQSESG